MLQPPDRPGGFFSFTKRVLVAQASNIFRQVLLLALISFLFFPAKRNGIINLKEAGIDWPVYLGGNSSAQYSPLDRINKGNVNQLTVAWEYHSGRDPAAQLSQIQCNPIIVAGVLYGTSPKLKVFALNAGNGTACRVVWQVGQGFIESGTGRQGQGQLCGCQDSGDCLQEPVDHRISGIRKHGSRPGQMFIPPSTQGTIIFPGFDGGAEWGGAAHDPLSRILDVNVNILPWIHTMVPVPEDEQETAHPAEPAYLINCATCHAQHRQGNSTS